MSATGPFTAAQVADIHAKLTPLQRAEIDLGARGIDLALATAAHADLDDFTAAGAAELAHRRAAIAYVIEEIRAYGKDTDWVERVLREISESIS
ncbi:MAG: hypothetical protein M3619_00755 [Myxococcota bacterium]|nr:hypothetical protein [Myxococcota bacterium]